MGVRQAREGDRQTEERRSLICGMIFSRLIMIRVGKELARLLQLAQDCRTRGLG